MGCCVSSAKTSVSSTPQNQQHSELRSIGITAPPPLEQEYVKEILSENPTPRKPPEQKKTVEPCSQKLGEEDMIEKKLVIPPPDEISELCNTCSFSESLSTATITEEKKMDDYEEIRHRICRSPAKFPNHRPFSDDWGLKREKQVGKSPTRKPDQSPGRRYNGGVGQQRNRSDNSCRRSRSPAAGRTAGVGSRTAAGRRSSPRRSGASPGRETGRREVPERKWPATNESLENPLVSLECFIFL